MKNIICRLFNKIERNIYFLFNSKGIILYYRKYGLTIGDRCQLLKNIVIPEPFLVKIGNDVKITDNVRLLTHDGGVYVIRNKYLLKNIDKFGRITIGNNVFIGNNVVILPGVTIGSNVVIGAGSIITKDISNDVVVAGVPATIIKTIDEYFETSKDEYIYSKNLDKREKEKLIKEKLSI